MNAAVIAVAWAVAGILIAGLVRFTRVRRAVALVPLAGAVAALVTGPGPGHDSVVLAPSGLTLGRTAQGLLVACGGSLALALLIAPRLDGREAPTYGLTGALVTLSLGTGSPVVWAVVLLAAVFVLSLRWIRAAPSRATFASARVPGAGGAALLAAAPFLPLLGVINGPRPAIATGLLGGGVASLLALVPLGGWARGALATLRGTEVLPWALLVAPAVLVVAERIPAATPAAGEDFGRILLAAGLVSGVFQALQATRAATRERYWRVLLADLGLAAAAVGSLHPSQALAGALLVIVTHLSLGPLFIHGGRPGNPLAHRLGWAALTGLPPAPSFWARFLLIEALIQLGPVQAAAALLVAGLIAVSALMSALEGGRLETPAGGDRWRTGPAAMFCVAAAFAAGLAPGAASSALFGV